jgi:hypothetical protein
VRRIPTKFCQRWKLCPENAKQKEAVKDNKMGVGVLLVAIEIEVPSLLVKIEKTMSEKNTLQTYGSCISQGTL